MVVPYVALTPTQEVETGRPRVSWRVALLSVLIGLSFVALWASSEGAEPVTASALAVQPARSVTPIERVPSRSFMQQAPQAVSREAQGARRTGPDPGRRSLLAGLALLPAAAAVERARAAPQKLKVDAFGPYFNYAGDLAVAGKVNVEGGGDGQQLSWDLSGLDPKCEAGPGAKPNSCGVHIHKGQSCGEDALGHYFATAEDPWKTITYTSKNSKAKSDNVKVATELTNAEVAGRTFIVHDFEGARVACGILK